MTCIAGIATGGQVWIGGDSLCVRNGTKITIAEGKITFNGEFLIGTCGNLRYSNITRHVFQPPTLAADADTDAYMANEFVRAWRECLKENGLLTIEDNFESQDGLIMVGVRGNLYQVDGSFGVCQSSEGYLAIGSGDNIALGALFATRGLPPEKRIRLALEAAEKWDDGVRGPFTIECVGKPKKGRR